MITKKQGYLFAVVLFLLDQLSKYFVVNNFYYIKNTGAAWGILKNSQTFLVITSLLVIFYAIYHFTYHPQAFSFLLGGVLGNLFDRIFRGYVIDFIDLHLFNYPLFNLADSFIVIGMILLALKIMKKE